MDKVLKLPAIAACASIVAAGGCSWTLWEEGWTSVVCVGNADGTGTALTIPRVGESDDLRPALSATGATVAWWRHWTQQGEDILHDEVYVVATAAPASPVELTSRGHAWGWFPAISDDGAVVAWVGGDGDESCDVFIGAADGTTVPARIGGGPAAGTSGPTLSGDGTRVAWTHYTSTGTAALERAAAPGTRWVVAEADTLTSVADDVWIANADGSGSPLNVTHNAGRDQDPSLSRDGTRIAWVSDRDGNLEVYVGNADGSGTPVHVSNDPGDDGEPRLSGDGTTVAWRAKDADGTRRIYVASAQGTPAPVEVSHNAEEVSRPSLSADGALVAWAEDHGDRATVYVARTDGSDRVAIATSAGQGTWPSLSADGTKVAWTGLQWFRR